MDQPRYNPHMPAGTPQFTLAALEWIQPAWLLGLTGAAAAPLLAHLFSRRRAKTFAFPAARFIYEAQTAQSRIDRPTHWLIWLMRALLLAMIAMAFAQPRWVSPSDTQPSQSRSPGASRVAFILDASASMQRTQAGDTLFDLAKRRLTDELLALNPQIDRAAVVVVGDRPRLLLPQPSGNLDQLALLLRQTDASAARGDMAGAVRLATQTFGNHAESENQRADCEIRLFTDMQATQFQSPKQLADAAAGAPLVWRVTAGPASNDAITRISTSPQTPTPGQRMTLAAEVRRFGSANGAQPRQLALYRNGVHIGERTIDPLAGSVWRTAFVVATPDDQLATLELRLQPTDHQPLDDALGVVITPAARRRLLVVTRADPRDAGSGAYYLARAASPSQRLAADSGSGKGEGDRADARNENTTSTAASAATWAVDWTTPEAAGDRLRSPPGFRPAAVVLIETGTVPDATLSALTPFVNQGGAALWIIDSEHAGAAAARWRDQRDLALSPLHVIANAAPRRDVAPSTSSSESASGSSSNSNSESASLTSLAAGDALWSLFDGPSRLAIQQATFGRRHPARLTAGAVELARWDIGGPAVALRSIGAGRVIAWSASLARDDTDFAVRGVFPAFLHELLHRLQPEPQQAPVTIVGAAMRIQAANPDTGRWKLVDPAGQMHPAFGRADRQSLWVDATPTQPGGLFVVDEQHQLLGGAWAVIDPRESDPNSSEITATSAAANRSANHTVAATQANRAAGRIIELGPWLLAIAIALAAAELLAARQTRRLPAETPA